MSSAAESIAARPGPPFVARMWKLVRVHLPTVYAALVFVYLLLPIGVVIAFSFNNPAGRFNYTWEAFTFSNWAHPFDPPELKAALLVSLRLAAIASLVAAALGSLMALAIVRYRFRGHGFANFMVFLPLTTPEIVMGASLLTVFISVGVLPGFRALLLAHIMFCISYVVVTVKARLVGFDRHLEEAAMDLGATVWTTARTVTFPLIAPGIFAAVLLAFALSVDDFIISNFNAGTTVTFPIFVWGAARFGNPPQVNVIGTMIFVTALTLMAINLIWQRTRE